MAGSNHTTLSDELVCVTVVVWQVLSSQKHLIIHSKLYSWQRVATKLWKYAHRDLKLQPIK